MISLAPSPFEQFAADKGHDLTRAVSPSPTRVYADTRTQEIYEAWMGGGAHVVRILKESTVETEAFRDKMREFMGHA
jgi:hypothetical protein